MLSLGRCQLTTSFPDFLGDEWKRTLGMRLTSWVLLWVLLVHNPFNGEVIVLSFVFTVKKNCAELYKSDQRTSGVYAVDPDGSGAFDVFCDQKAASGGWTVIQKRLDGSVDFQRGWNDYKRGFGSLNGEFWLGLDKMNRLTKTKSRLRVELEDTKGNAAYAEYDFFAVASERALYKMSLGNYYGE